jgi:ribokinase
MPDAITIGSVNMDIIVKVDDFPKEDSEVAARSLKLMHGGSAANVAVGISRLGHSSGFIGIIGKDEFGDSLLKELKNEGVDVSGISKEEGNSGTLIVAVDKNGKRTMFASNDAPSKFERKHVPADYIKRSKFIHIASIIGENVLDAFEYAVTAAKEAGAKITFDPGAILSIQGAEKLEGILKDCYIVMPNPLEIEVLTGKKEVEGAKELLKYGPDNVIVKLGGRGAVLVNRERVKYFDKKKIYFTTDFDTTGAGDAFAAGLISALLENKTLDEAIDYGLATSAYSINFAGARACPTKDEISKHL